MNISIHIFIKLKNIMANILNLKGNFGTLVLIRAPSNPKRNIPENALHKGAIILFQSRFSSKPSPEKTKMSPETSKSHKIRRIVRLRQMLQHWRKKARAAANRAPPADVPAGHVAVCVGSDCRRFIVRATFLNHPIFRKLLSQAEEEYGFETRGPLALPCDESVFEEVVQVVARSELSNSSRNSNLKDLQRRCDEDVRIKNLEFLGESRPLLYGFSDNKSVC